MLIVFSSFFEITIEQFYHLSYCLIFGVHFCVQYRIRKLVEEFESKYRSINDFYNETLIGDKENLSTEKEVLQAKESIVSDQKVIKDILKSIEEEASDLENFHSNVFGELNENNERAGGLSRELNNLISALKKFEEEQKIKYKALNEEIESLLPGATSAGLATAYSEMKSSFDEPIKHATGLFYFSLGLLIAGSIFLSIEKIGGDSWVIFTKFDNLEAVLKGLIYKSPFYAPVLWLSFYATKRRSEYSRLQQEYAHKEALAKSYQNYKKQLQELGDLDNVMQQEFIKMTIDAIAYNASQTLDKKHGDKLFIHEMIEKAINKPSNGTANTKPRGPA